MALTDVRFESAPGAWIRVAMGEGRKRQIQEICCQLGLSVVRIVRIRIGTLRLGNLKPRQWMHLTTKEVEELKQPAK
jgi:23S rRNA pseudouridine2605 synthase